MEEVAIIYDKHEFNFPCMRERKYNQIVVFAFKDDFRMCAGDGIDDFIEIILEEYYDYAPLQSISLNMQNKKKFSTHINIQNQDIKEITNSLKSELKKFHQSVILSFCYLLK